MQSLRTPAQTDPAFAPSAHCGVQRQAESTNVSLFTPSTLPSQYRHTPMSHCSPPPRSPFSIQTHTNVSLFTPSTLPSQYRHTPMSHRSPPPRSLLNTDTHQCLIVHPLHAPFSIQTHTSVSLFTPSTLLS